MAETHLPALLFGLFPAALLRLSPALLALDILTHLSGHIVTLGNLLGLNKEKKGSMFCDKQKERYLH